MTIREFVEMRLPESIEKFEDKGDADGKGSNPDVVSASIGSTMVRMFKPGTVETMLDEFTRQYVADMVVYDMIPALIDYVQWQTRRQDSMASAPGTQRDGGGNSSNYDRVQALKDLGELIGKRLDQKWAEFEGRTGVLLFNTGGGTLSSGPKVDKPFELKTERPDDFRRINWPWLSPAPTSDIAPEQGGGGW